MSESLTDLEKDIEASRARLDQTIDRIQDRLAPSSLVDEMLGTARRSPALSGVYDDALDAVRRNPVPVLLIAAGVGLLLNRIVTTRRPATLPVPVVRAPAPGAGAERAYDPDQPAGRPARDLEEAPTA